MRDRRTNFGARGIGTLMLRLQRLARRAGEMDPGDQPSTGDMLLVLARAVRSIGSDPGCRIGLVQPSGPFPSVVAGRIGDGPSADQAVTLVDVDM